MVLKGDGGNELRGLCFLFGCGSGIDFFFGLYKFSVVYWKWRLNS